MVLSDILVSILWLGRIPSELAELQKWLELSSVRDASSDRRILFTGISPVSSGNWQTDGPVVGQHLSFAPPPPLLTLFVLREDNFVERPAPVSATTYERFKLVSFVFRTLSNRRVKYEAKERGKVFIRPFRGKQTNLPSLPAGQNDEKKANELGQRVRDSSSDESR